MFNVEIVDSGVAIIRTLFHITPVIVYDPWKDYRGTVVWRCNQSRTYTLPGEPTDSRWHGLFTDGILAGWELRAKLWKRFKEDRPEEAAALSEAEAKQARWDSDTMMLHGAALVGGTVKRTPEGSLTIILPESKPAQVGNAVKTGWRWLAGLVSHDTE